MTLLNLTDEELGRMGTLGEWSPGVRAAIDAAMDRLAIRAGLGDTPAYVGDFVSRLVIQAQREGRLEYSRMNVRACDCCQKSAGFMPYTRNTRYHKKGDPNHARPRAWWGIQVSWFVCCPICWERVKPVLVKALEDIRAEIDENITGYSPRFKKYQNVACQCGWTGHEGQLGKLPALTGGYYPGQCPQCGAKNLPLNMGQDPIYCLKSFTIEET